MRAGLSSFDSIRSRMSFQLDGLCNRKPPFGEELLRAVRALPVYGVSGRQVLEGPSQARVLFKIDLLNREYLARVFASRDGPTAGHQHTLHFCVSAADDSILLYRKIRDESMLRASLEETVCVLRRDKETSVKCAFSLLSESWIGLGIQRRDFSVSFALLEAKVDYQLFPLFLPPSDTPAAVPQPQSPPQPPPHLPDQTTVASIIAADLAPPCSHRCRDKAACLHECCKTSGRMRKKMRTQHQQPSIFSSRPSLPQSARHMIRKGINVLDDEGEGREQPVILTPASVSLSHLKRSPATHASRSVYQSSVSGSSASFPTPASLLAPGTTSALAASATSYQVPSSSSSSSAAAAATDFTGAAAANAGGDSRPAQEQRTDPSLMHANEAASSSMTRGSPAPQERKQEPSAAGDLALPQPQQHRWTTSEWTRKTPGQSFTDRLSVVGGKWVYQPPSLASVIEGRKSPAAAVAVAKPGSKAGECRPLFGRRLLPSLPSSRDSIFHAK